MTAEPPAIILCEHIPVSSLFMDVHGPTLAPIYSHGESPRMGHHCTDISLKAQQKSQKKHKFDENKKLLKP